MADAPRPLDPLVPAFAACEALGWAEVPGAVAGDVVEALRVELATVPRRPLAPSVGPVRQGGASGVAAIAGLPVCEALAGRCALASGGWRPDELAVTAYGPGDGISPHRDNAFYVGFVAVVTLAGRARLRVVADRDGEVELGGWEARPGHVALLRGPRPGGEARPLHEVGDPGPAGRLVAVLRTNQRGPGAGWGAG